MGTCRGERMNKVHIIFSETWLKATCEEVEQILEETIKEFMQVGERIINIEKIKREDGLSRFWIYVEERNEI